jgi:hypothetical protein
LARRRLHGLLLGGSDQTRPEDVVAHLTAVQAQDHGIARWSVAQRTSRPPSLSAVDAAFDAGRLLRTHVLRPTWHFVVPGDLRWLIRLSGPRLDAANARYYRDLDLDARTLARANDVLSGAVDGGHRTRRELAAALDAAGIASDGGRLPFVLLHAEFTARLCSGAMRGAQHTYAAFDHRVPAGDGPSDDEALATLAWRYFSTRGPATVADFAWWAGLSAADARAGLDAVAGRLDQVVDEDRTYWWAGEDSRRRSPARIDLVQCFDEAVVSYRHPRTVLHLPGVDVRAMERVDGFLHLLLLEGRVLGHWRPAGTGRAGGGSRPEAVGDVEVRITRPLDPVERRALERGVDRYRRGRDR